MGQIKKLAILGSTGSVGRQSLEIVKEFSGKYSVSILLAGKNTDILQEQISLFEPELVLIEDDEAYQKIKSKFQSHTNEIKRYNDEFNLPLHEYKIDLVINALPSIHGFIASFLTLKKGINLALANKESLLIAGDLIMSMAEKSGSKILPIDSEASAIFQCLEGENPNDIEKIYLTASGGPFYHNQKSKVTKSEVLEHPIWSMGPKISVDSATMMNKAFEMYEIHQLFGVPLDKIQVIIHPESIVHSMIQFKDGQTKALISEPDMKLPIAHAMSYPKRHFANTETTNIFKSNWNFDPLVPGQFACFDMALTFLKKGHNFPAALVIINDHFVNAFLNNKIDFEQIGPSIQTTMEGVESRQFSDLNDVVEYVKECQEKCPDLVKS